jgi:hypothetical protein
MLGWRLALQRQLAAPMEAHHGGTENTESRKKFGRTRHGNSIATADHPQYFFIE